jgi:hypothetical protein
MRMPKIYINAAANGAVGFVAQAAVGFFCAVLVCTERDALRHLVAGRVDPDAFLTLFDLGVAASWSFGTWRLEATRDRDQPNRVFNTSLSISRSPAAAGDALAIAFPGMQWLHVDAELAAEARWMMVLLGFNLAIGLPLTVFLCVLDGLGKFPVKTAIRTSILLARVPLFCWFCSAAG